jgi:phage-related protein
MNAWTLLDYVELSGRNPIREWLGKLPDDDRAKIDYRLLQMAGEPTWREKWISKYRGTDDIYEFRITGNKVQYRPLGTYFGKSKYLILAGAIERGNKIPKSDIDTAERRLANAKADARHYVKHQFGEEDGDGYLEEDGEKGLS